MIDRKQARAIADHAEKRLNARATRVKEWICERGWYFIAGGAGLFVALLVWVF